MPSFRGNGASSRDQNRASSSLTVRQFAISVDPEGDCLRTPCTIVETVWAQKGSSRHEHLFQLYVDGHPKRDGGCLYDKCEIYCSCFKGIPRWSYTREQTPNLLLVSDHPMLYDRSLFQYSWCSLICGEHYKWSRVQPGLIFQQRLEMAVLV